MPGNKPELLLDSGPYKGLDTWTSSYYVNPQRATDLLNVLPDTHLGAFNTALGRTTLVTGAMGSAVLGLAKFPRQSLTTQYLAASNDGDTAGHILNAVAGAGSWTRLTTPITLTASQTTVFAQYQAWMFESNGTDPPLKIDFTLAVTRWQIAAPTGAPTAADSGSAGNLNGTYFYRYSYSNASQESSPGPISASVTVTNHSVSLSVLTASGDAQTTTVNIYRLGGTWSVWLLVGTVANGTTTFTDNVADGNLGQAMVLHRDPPPAFFYITPHKERIFGFGLTSAPSDLYYTNYKEPWAFDTTNQIIPINRNLAGDTAQGLASTGSLLTCFKNYTAWAVYGETSTDFLALKLFDIGCIAPRSITVALGVVFWLAKDGVWMFDGQRPSRISSNIRTTLASIAVADLSRAVGFFRDGMFYLSFPSLGVTYAYDLVTEEWYKLGWAAEVAIYDLSASEVDGSRTGLGNVDTWFSAATDLGSAISATWNSKSDDAGRAFAAKRYRYAILLAPLQSGVTAQLAFTMNPGTGSILETRTVDLSVAPVRKRVSLPVDMIGFQAQLQVTVTASVQVEIQKVQLWGWPLHVFAPSANS